MQDASALVRHICSNHPLMRFCGKSVCKPFLSEGRARWFYGVVVRDVNERWVRVEYADGDAEDMDVAELARGLVAFQHIGSESVKSPTVIPETCAHCAASLCDSEDAAQHLLSHAGAIVWIGRYLPFTQKTVCEPWLVAHPADKGLVGLEDLASGTPVQFVPVGQAVAEVARMW